MAAWDDVIDFDNVGEWPMELSGWLKLLQSSTDQEQRSQTVQLVRKCLQGARIRTYHCTRLLPSEVESIKGNGLLPASPELARDKREAARATLAAHCLSGRKRIPLARYGFTIGNRIWTPPLPVPYCVLGVEKSC